MSASYGKGAKAKATKLHSLIVRSRGACERCGERYYPKLQAAHIIPRARSATRTLEQAAWCLCASCHFAVDNFAHLKMDLVDRTIGREEYDRLYALATHGTTKVDWVGELDRLRAVWARIEEAA
jgi:hypothetical protein